MEFRPWTRFYDYSVPDTFRIPRTTVPYILAQPANANPKKAAVDFFGTTLTFYELRQLVLRFSNALAKQGVSKGDRVAIQLPNCPQYLIAYYATLTLGAVVVNLNPMYTPDELKLLVSETSVSTFITFDMVLPNIKALMKDVKIDRVVVTSMADFIKGAPRSTAESLKLEPGWFHFSKLIDDCTTTKLPKNQPSAEDPAVIQFTGGTTGIPKGAVLTHSNVVAAVLATFHWGSVVRENVPKPLRNVLGVIPFFHVFGNIVAMNYAMWSCSTLICVPRFEIEEFIGLLAKYEHITFWPAVPAMVNAVLNHPKTADLNLDSKIGQVSTGGAPMPVELIERVLDLNIAYVEGWGMSETCSTGISGPLIGVKKPGSIGIPQPNVDVKFVDLVEGKTEVKKGEPGELCIKGPTVMKGYWNRPKETAEELIDGWLHTGDIAIQDEEDYIFLVDRKKDMVIAGGYNIYPREIDEVLFQHPKICDAVAVGIPDQYRGETIKAYVVIKPGQTATEKEIVDFCRTKLAAYKAPKLIEFRDALPKSAAGKVLRKILRAEEEAKLKSTS
jgi:long-chain acyl-CoA synthetase